MAINTHQADHVEYIQDSNGNKHYLNAEYLDGHSYGDISNAIGGKADQSAIHDGTLTIQKNGATIATFTANQDKSATANITVPTSIDGLTGGTVNGNITLTKELVFANNQNPFIKMSTAGNTYFFQSAGGQFSLGPTWDLATKWSVDGSVQFPKKVDFAVRPVVGSKEVALKSEIPAAVSESTVSGWGFTKNKGTVTSVATADGITGGSITSSGTIKANLKSYTKNTAEIGGRLYGVELDKNGKLAVNVPWTDTKNTAGSMNDPGKLYLVGAKTQDANPQTYSYSHVYMTDGTLAAPALSTRNIVLPESNLGLKFVDGDNVASAANFHYSSLGGADLSMTGHLVLNEAGAHPDKPENKTGLDYMSCADYFDTGIAMIGKRTSSDLPSIIRLSFPEKTGTIALTSDLSTLLDKGTSSTVENQVVYNPVEMKKNLSVPSLSGEKTTIAGNSISTFGLGGTKDGSTAMSDLTLVGFSGTSSINNVYTTHIQQLRNGIFQIAQLQGETISGSILTYDGQWRIDGNAILTEENLKKATNTYLGLIKPWYSTTGASTYNGSSTAPSAGSDTPSINTRSTTSGRYYLVEMDANGRAYVNVPWFNTDTHIAVDSSLNSTSTSPLQNKAIYSAFSSAVGYDYDYYVYGENGSWRMRQYNTRGNSLDIRYGVINITSQSANYDVSFSESFIATDYTVVFGLYRSNKQNWFWSPIVQSKTTTGFKVFVQGNASGDNGGKLMYLAIRSN